MKSPPANANTRRTAAMRIPCAADRNASTPVRSASTAGGVGGGGGGGAGGQAQMDRRDRHHEGGDRQVAERRAVARQARAGERAGRDADREQAQEQGDDVLVGAEVVLGVGREQRQVG